MPVFCTFLEIGSLDFPESWHGARDSYKVVHDSQSFWKKLKEGTRRKIQVSRSNGRSRVLPKATNWRESSRTAQDLRKNGKCKGKNSDI